MVKYKCPLLVVKDMQKSLDFYCKVLGLRVVSDFGANKTLTGGLSLQTLDTWTQFIATPVSQINFGGKNAEIYLETNNLQKVNLELTKANAVFVHGPKTHEWGQCALRVLDPDSHIIEIGETLTAVANRFSSQGLSPQQIADRMGVPLRLAQNWLKQKT